MPLSLFHFNGINAQERARQILSKHATLPLYLQPWSFITALLSAGLLNCMESPTLSKEECADHAFFLGATAALSLLGLMASLTYVILCGGIMVRDLALSWGFGAQANDAGAPQAQRFRLSVTAVGLIPSLFSQGALFQSSVAALQYYLTREATNLNTTSDSAVTPQHWLLFVSTLFGQIILPAVNYCMIKNNSEHTHPQEDADPEIRPLLANDANTQPPSNHGTITVTSIIGGARETASSIRA